MVGGCTREVPNLKQYLYSSLKLPKHDPRLHQLPLCSTMMLSSSPGIQERGEMRTRCNYWLCSLLCFQGTELLPEIPFGCSSDSINLEITKWKFSFRCIWRNCTVPNCCCFTFSNVPEKDWHPKYEN